VLGMAQWRLLSNHGRVLIYLARDPRARLRDVAEGLDITERSAHRIVSELVDGGYLDRKRNGTRNHYEVHLSAPLDDPLLDGRGVGDILPLAAGSNGR
jgi:DNA-binding MarR family transcriptional regulator